MKTEIKTKKQKVPQTKVGELSGEGDGLVECSDSPDGFSYRMVGKTLCCFLLRAERPGASTSQVKRVPSTGCECVRPWEIPVQRLSRVPGPRTL